MAQLLPKAQILVVTTPQAAAADVAERAGAIATQTGQTVAGVVENMSYLEMPDGGRMELFGSGGGSVLAERLSRDGGRRGAAAGPDSAGHPAARGRRRRATDRAGPAGDAGGEAPLDRDCGGCWRQGRAACAG